MRVSGMRGSRDDASPAGTRTIGALMKVRTPTVDDAPALGAIHVRAWQRAYRGGLMPDDYLDALAVEDRAAMWHEALQRDPRPGASRLVAEDADGEVVGFILVGSATGDDDERVGEVYALNVDPDAWGGGFGRALLEAGEAALGEAGFERAVLWVHPGNERACRFYERAGWEADGTERTEEVLGVRVPEVRYRRRLAIAGPATRS